MGGIHGINGFLNIGGLADEHFKMASVLDGMRNELELMPSDDINGMHDLAERAYGQLVDRDTQWEEGAKKVNLKPA